MKLDERTRMAEKAIGHRSYRIERDANGVPSRLVWQGDYRRVPVLYVTCPRCPSSPRLVHGRCFTCWGDWRRESTWVPA